MATKQEVIESLMEQLKNHAITDETFEKVLERIERISALNT